MSQDIDFFLSRPSCHFPLDFAGLRYRPYRHSLHGCPKMRTIGNAFSATRFRKTGGALSTKYSGTPIPPLFYRYARSIIPLGTAVPRWTVFLAILLPSCTA